MENYLLISDAAKEVKVESHVLRYWEEELHLPIKRNEMGHRYYTEEDVERFKQIKGMKERGLQLKAIKMILKDGRLDVLSMPADSVAEEAPAREMGAAEEGGMQAQLQMEPSESENGLAIDIIPGKSKQGEMVRESKEDKSRRLQWLLQQLIRQTLQENNSDLCREIRESVVKELDYQFRMQEEREEARDRMLAERDEEHYKKMDELLRKKSRHLKKGKQDKMQDVDSGKHTDEKNQDAKAMDTKKRRFFS